MTTKQIIREQALEYRLSLSIKQRKKIDKKIVDNLEKTLKTHFHLSQLFLYYPFRNEPSILHIIKRVQIKNIGLPVITPNKNMEFVQWQKGDVWVKNRYGINEPTVKQVLEPSDQTVMIIPSLATNHDGFRIGYGGGFYDRYLQKFPAIKTIGVVNQAFSKQDFVPEIHDVRLDLVVTEESIFD